MTRPPIPLRSGEVVIERRRGGWEAVTATWPYGDDHVCISVWSWHRWGNRGWHVEPESGVCIHSRRGVLRLARNAGVCP